MNRFAGTLHRALVVIVVLAVTGVWSCKKSGPGADSKVAALAAETGAVAMPEGILGFMGVRSLDDFLAGVGGIVGRFSPQMAPMVTAQVPALLQGQLLGVRSMTWMDAKKPLRIVLMDYKKYGKPLVVQIPITTREALEAALPETRSPGAPDNEIRFAAPGGEVFLNVLGDTAVFTLEAGAFAAVKTFLTGDLARYPFDELLDVQISMTNLMAVAGPEIEAFQAQIEQASTGQAGAAFEGMDKLLKDEIAWLMDALGQTEVSRLVLRFDGDNAELRFGVKVADGKGLSRFAADTANRKLESLAALPSDAWFMFAANVDPMLFEGLSTLGFDFYAGFLQMDDAEKAKLDSLMKATLSIQTGDSAFSIRKDGDFPFRVTSITGVSDGDKARTVIYEVYGLLFSKLGAQIETVLGADVKSMPKLDWTSFDAFTASAKPVLAQAGVTMELLNRKVGKATVDSLEISVDYTKVPGAGEIGELDAVSKAFGNKVSLALAFDNDKMIGTFGKDAVADVEALAQVRNGGEPLATLAKNAGFNVGLAGILSVVELLNIVNRFYPAVTEATPGLATMTKPAAIGLLVGAHGERIIDGVITVPVTELAALLTETRVAPAQ
jgi:hypothetical protein